MNNTGITGEKTEKFHQTRYSDGKQANGSCLTSLGSREMQIKTTMMYHYTAIKISKIKKTVKHQMLSRLWRNWIPHTVGIYIKWYRHPEYSLAEFLKSKHAATIGPATVLLGIYLREMKNSVHRKTCT